MESLPVTKEEPKLRLVEEHDIEMLYQWNNQAFFGPWQDCRLHSICEIRNRFKSGGFNTDTFLLLIVEDRKEHPIGMATCDFTRNWIAQIGISIQQEFRGCGMGKKIGALLMKYLFDNYPIRKISADTDIKNVAGQKVLVALGFKQEGILRSQRFHHGEFHDAFFLRHFAERIHRPDAEATLRHIKPAPDHALE